MLDLEQVEIAPEGIHPKRSCHKENAEKHTEHAGSADRKGTHEARKGLAVANDVSLGTSLNFSQPFQLQEILQQSLSKLSQSSSNHSLWLTRQLQAYTFTHAHGDLCVFFAFQSVLHVVQEQPLASLQVSLCLQMVQAGKGKQEQVARP